MREIVSLFTSAYNIVIDILHPNSNANKYFIRVYRIVCIRVDVRKQTSVRRHRSLSACAFTTSAVPCTISCTIHLTLHGHVSHSPCISAFISSNLTWPFLCYTLLVQPAPPSIQHFCNNGKPRKTKSYEASLPTKNQESQGRSPRVPSHAVKTRRGR